MTGTLTNGSKPWHRDLLLLSGIGRVRCCGDQATAGPQCLYLVPRFRTATSGGPGDLGAQRASDPLAKPAWQVHRCGVSSRSSADSRSLVSPYRSIRAQMAKQKVIASSIRLGMP